MALDLGADGLHYIQYAPTELPNHVLPLASSRVVAGCNTGHQAGNT